MKTTIKLFLLVILIGTSVLAQDQEYDCKFGVLIGNSNISGKPLTIVYSQTIRAKCKKGKSLYLGQGVKQKIIVQFFNRLNKDYPEYLKPFEQTSANVIMVWETNSDEEFENRIKREFITHKYSYNILKIDDFVYDPNLDNEVFKSSLKEMRSYLRKKRN